MNIKPKYPLLTYLQAVDGFLWISNKAGFTPVLANEIGPQFRETYR